jgi:hypothetical protein
MEECKTLSQP